MSTHAREIPSAEWSEFFGATSRHFSGRQVRIEFAAKDIGLYILGENLPLLGMTLEKSGVGPKVEVIAGDREGGHVTHVISSPAHVWIRQPVNGTDNAVFIENAAGQMILVELESQTGRHGEKLPPFAEPIGA